MEGGFDNSSEEKECAQDVSNEAERKGYSKDNESKYNEETQEKRNNEEMEARRRKSVAAAGLAKAMTRVANGRNSSNTKEKAKKSKSQYPRINIKESASVFEVLVKADIIVARRHGKEKAGDK